MVLSAVTTVPTPPSRLSRRSIRNSWVWIRHTPCTWTATAVAAAALDLPAMESADSEPSPVSAFEHAVPVRTQAARRAIVVFV